MQSLRILIVTHAPISPRFGAGQMAINLAEAFREQGHDVTLWSPLPLHPQTKWWQSVQQMRSKLDAFISTQEPFDIIDVPSLFITKKIGQLPLVVARSVQPDILYIAENIKDCKIKNIKDIIRIPLGNLYSLFQIMLILQGWRRAKYILCLGSLELKWMERWFPWWKNKFIYYLNALSEEDREVLAEVRLKRQERFQKLKLSETGTKFLWIGRWVAHKGTAELLEFISKWSALNHQDTFTIAGCGEKAKQYFPAELIQSGALKVIPVFERNQLFTLLASHDVGLFTSKVEGWGLVLNEMLESGLLVYATQAGGVPELKPFFKEKLLLFPPCPETLNVNTMPNGLDMQTYYQKFTWNTIAKDYLSAVLSISV